jgi:uncharacterized Zn-finger protein
MNTSSPPVSLREGALPNAQREVTLGPADLPLHCPRPDQSLWNSHPRVYLPIAPGQRVRCPYCGTLYVLPAA